jgi:sulfatase modifying factor 1
MDLKRRSAVLAGLICTLVVAGEAVAQTPGAGAVSVKDCAECPEMIAIPAGSFTMGTGDNEEESEQQTQSLRGFSVPRHDVRVPAFLAGKYEVTRDEYAAFVAETKHADTSDCAIVASDGAFTPTKGASWRNPGFEQTGVHPVTCVDWNDANAYAEWLSKKTGKAYRLLSEAEWEYAARAGTTTRRYWGDSPKEQCLYAKGADHRSIPVWPVWQKDIQADCDSGYLNTAPAGTFKPNGFGLYDMLGNVHEWVRDCWNPTYHGAPSDGSAWMTGQCAEHPQRSGSWSSYYWRQRSAYRASMPEKTRRSALGFRVARDM